MALCELRYFSPALGKQTACNVIVPEKGTAPFRTVYLLHGLSDDYTIWLRRTGVERYLDAMATPPLIVMPDGGTGFYGDAVDGDAYEAALLTDLVPRIERTFPVRAERDGRSLAGLSMGGYGALRLALRRPDMFCAAASHSGALQFGHSTERWDNTPYPPFIRRILGENHVGGPFDLYALTQECPATERPALYIDCGTEDFLIGDNREFHAFLVAQSIQHIYIEHPGAHTWDYWDTYVRDSLTFLIGKMQPPTPLVLNAPIKPAIVAAPVASPDTA